MTSKRSNTVSSALTIANMDGSPDSTSSIRRRSGASKDERDDRGAIAPLGSSLAYDDSVDSKETTWTQFATEHLSIVQLILVATVLGVGAWATQSFGSIMVNEPTHPHLNLRSKGNHVASPPPQCKLREPFLFFLLDHKFLTTIPLWLTCRWNLDGTRLSSPVSRVWHLHNQGR